ncbi:MAG: aspartate 1-decarboxylase [Spirochaetes bacterium]|nr:aspartate 1-decarboxylase [Spirochaetota bacterium]
MLLCMLKSKIHMARVTDTQINYEGSITIDEDLIKKVNLLAHERVLIANVDNGNRFVTYVITGKKGSKEICINGAAARLAKKGDRIIIMSFAWMEEEKARTYQSSIIKLDGKNNIIS